MSTITLAGDAVIGMAVTHLVFASTSSADCQTLHDRRKVMVTLEGSLLSSLLQGLTRRMRGGFNAAALAC